MVCQTAGLVCLMLCVTSVMCFYIGACWSFIQFIDDIANELIKIDSLNEDDTTEQNQMMKHFCTTVQLYSDVKQLRAPTKIAIDTNLTTKFFFLCRSLDLLQNLTYATSF